MTAIEYRQALDALPYGKRLPGALYLIDPGDDPRIPALLRITVAGLRKRLEIGTEFNLLKFHTASPKISFLAYPEFKNAFWESVLELGRMPRDEEFDRLAEVRQACGSLPRALQLFIDRFGEPTFAAARKRRKEDLLVFVAAAQLEFGYLDPKEGHFTIHRSLLDELPVLLRVFVECAPYLYGNPPRGRSHQNPPAFPQAHLPLLPRFR